ncbi:hypothetical protein Tco_1503382 [Tanacetum coccineum]
MGMYLDKASSGNINSFSVFLTLWITFCVIINRFTRIAVETIGMLMAVLFIKKPSRLSPLKTELNSAFDTTRYTEDAVVSECVSKTMDSSMSASPVTAQQIGSSVVALAGSALGHINYVENDGGTITRLHEEVMDDPNITMEEYIQLMADKARGSEHTFNWETATYGEVYCEDLDSFTDFKTDFPAIVYNDASTSNQNVSSEPTVSIYNAIKSDIDFHISFSDSEDEDYTFIYNKDSYSYKLIHANDLKPEPVNNYVEINIESCSENIDIKPMDSVICISNDTTAIEFDDNIETDHDTSGKSFVIKDFVLIIKIMISKCFKGMPFIFIIKNLYVPFGIPFDPKLFDKDGIKLGQV